MAKVPAGSVLSGCAGVPGAATAVSGFGITAAGVGGEGMFASGGQCDWGAVTATAVSGFGITAAGVGGEGMFASGGQCDWGAVTGG